MSKIRDYLVQMQTEVMDDDRRERIFCAELMIDGMTTGEQNQSLIDQLDWDGPYYDDRWSNDWTYSLLR